MSHIYYRLLRDYQMTMTMREKNLGKSGLQRKASADYCQIDLKETSVPVLKCEVPGRKIRPSNESYFS